MKEIPISTRLKTLAQYIPRGSVLADIGSDHAYLPCYAVLQGIIEKAVAGEVNEGPLQSAKETIEKYGLTAAISARLGSGLSVIEKGEVNAITIAGMGGDLIRHILEEGYERMDSNTKLILQPNVAENRVRSWLAKEAWEIIEEVILEEDGHIYEIIVADKRQAVTPLTEDELLFGPILIKKKGPVFRKKWISELKKRERILQSLSHASSGHDIESRRSAISIEIQRIREVLE